MENQTEKHGTKISIDKKYTFYNEFIKINKLETIDIELSLQANRLGFDYFAYGLILSTSNSLPRQLVRTNLPPSWNDLFKGNKDLSRKMFTPHLETKLLPKIWTKDIFASFPELQKQAQLNGINFGIVQTTCSTPGITGILSLARRYREIYFSELDEKLVHLNLLTQTVHKKYLEKILPLYIPESRHTLTPREKEIIKWTADGKTSHETSVILNITERTVNFHINNAIKKLNVTNKTAAVAKAINLGMIKDEALYRGYTDLSPDLMPLQLAR